MKPYRAYVISHTHWDREWYQTFQQYRRRLVRMIDGLIDTLEKDESYRCFHFDGQTVVLEDYLRIRPANRERLRRQIQAGRIVIGPWYVMPDEFLVSGESLVRNLQKGMGLCGEWGVPPMPSGYVTDIFGHNSQFPQILRGFGLENAVLYRGIGDYEKDAFRWESPDGSAVTAYKLDRIRSYSNFYFALRWPYEKLAYSEEDLIERGRKLAAHAKSLAAGHVLLMMDGVDHGDAEERLPEMLRILNDNIPDVEFIHAPFAAFHEAFAADGAPLETIRGPLYHLGQEGINNQVLKNVLSSMVQLKQANDRCEVKLTRMAAPIEALLYHNLSRLKPDTFAHSMFPFEGYLEEAWTYLLKNQPHDSICGCSLSEVHMDNEYRFRQCEQIADLMTAEGLSLLAHNLDWDETGRNGGFLLYNFAQVPCRGMAAAEVELPVDIGADFSLYDSEGREVAYQILATRPGLKKIAPYNTLIEMRATQFLTLALPVDIPAFGYAAFTFADNHNTGYQHGDYNFQVVKRPYRMQGSLRTDTGTFDNGVLTVRVKENGALCVTDKRTGRIYDGLLTFEDGGDAGDGWNYRKPLADKQFVTACSPCEFAILSDGENAAVFSITHRLAVPGTAADPAVRAGAPEVLEFETRVTLLKDCPRIAFETRLHNTVECHRLRVLFPTRMDADVYYTATPFDMQEWPVKKEDSRRFTEVETNVTPSQGITFIGDGSASVALYTQGLYEVEVMDNPSRTVALTLFRAFAYETGTPVRNYADMKRDLCFAYALDFEPASPAEALRLADRFRCGLQAECLEGKGSLPLSGSLLRLEGEAALSTLYAVSQEESVLRFVNVGDGAVRQSVGFGRPVAGARRMDFLGRDAEGEVQVQGDTVHFSVEPHKVATLSVRFA